MGVGGASDSPTSHARMKCGAEEVLIPSFSQAPARMFLDFLERAIKTAIFAVAPKPWKNKGFHPCKPGFGVAKIRLFLDF